ITMHENESKIVSTKVLIRPGSGMPIEAREAARKNREIKPPTRPAMSAATTQIGHEERTLLFGGTAGCAGDCCEVIDMALSVLSQAQASYRLATDSVTPASSRFLEP